MRKLKIESNHGDHLTGQLPEGWHEVALAAYAALAATAQPVPELLEPGAHVFASEAGVVALASLLGLPSAEPFLLNPSLLLEVYDAAPWLFNGPLPAGETIQTFAHGGVSYQYAGGLDRALGGQMESLLRFVQQHDGNPLGCGPKLLAVLYQRAGQKQTPAHVAAAAAAFDTLPMSIAYPALMDFLQRSASLASPIQRYLALRPAVEKALSALEMIPASPLLARPGFWSNTRRWLLQTWIRLVRKRLAIFSPPFATTAKRPS